MKKLPWFFIFFFWMLTSPLPAGPDGKHPYAIPCGESLENYQLIPNDSFSSFVSQYFSGQIAPEVYLQENCPVINAIATYDQEGNPAIIVTKRLVDFLYANAVWVAYSWVYYVRDSAAGNVLGNQVILPQPHMREIVSRLISIWEAYLQNTEPSTDNLSVLPEDENLYTSMRDGIFTGEIAFVLGHEIGHWVNGDVHQAIVAAGLNPNYLKLVNLGKLMRGRSLNALSRARESKADQVGEQFVFALQNDSPIRLNPHDKAYWLPLGMSLAVLFEENAEFIDKVREQESPESLSNHPNWNTRWRRICEDGLKHVGWQPKAASLNCLEIQRQFHGNVLLALSLIQQR